MGFPGIFIFNISSTLQFHGRIHAKHASGRTSMLLFDGLRLNLHKTMIKTEALHVIWLPISRAPATWEP